MFDSRLPQDINFDSLVFRCENSGVGSISAVSLHINSICSYVLKTWWVYWSWVACKINYWHCPLRNPILKVRSVFYFLNTLQCKNAFLLLLVRAFFKDVSTCWNTLARMHAVRIPIWNRWKLRKRFTINIGVHSAAWSGLRSVPLMFVLQSGNKISLHFVVEADLGEILGDPDLQVRHECGVLLRVVGV